MSSIEHRASKALLSSSSTSGVAGKGLLVAGGSALVLTGISAILPFGILFWAVVAIIAGLVMVEK